MKKLKGKSLRFRINLWYTVLMSVLSVFLIACLAAAGQNVEHSQVQRNLIRNVERNIDEIEVEDNILDIETDFAYENDGIYSIVFNAYGKVLGGAYPDGISVDAPLENGRFDSIDAKSGEYYYYDSLIEFQKYEYRVSGIDGEIIGCEGEGCDVVTPFEGNLDQKGEDCEITYRQAYYIALNDMGIAEDSATLMVAKMYEYDEMPIYEIEFYSEEKCHDDVWVRGVVKSTNQDGIFGTLAFVAALLLPFAIALSAFIGDKIAKNAIRPIKYLSRTVAETRNGNDLTKEITLIDSDPEIIKLTENFNEMFKRLQLAFENEKQFSSDVSHELRTPLAVIIAECEYQLSDNSLSEEARESLESIFSQAQLMQKLISQLLYFARVEQGRETVSMSEESFTELLTDLCQNIRNVTDKVTLETDIQENITMQMDMSLIVRLCDNLISNAVRYTDKGGTVKVSLKKENGKILFSVKDNGIGISKEDLPKIWHRFYRVDKARSREEGCSGLGLPMVKEIANIHGASVFAESELGKGSEFRVEF